MPIYEFYCKRCKKKFECLLFTGDEPVCPTCKGKDLTKLISKVRVGASNKSESDSNTGASKCSCCSGGDCSSC